MDRRLAVSLVQMDVSTYTNYHTNFFLHSLVFVADCQGTGAKTVKRGFMYMQSPCNTCRGTGSVIKDPCPSCSGQGRVTETKTVDVKIPPGVDTGINLRVGGQGDDGLRGGPAGDLYVEVVVKQDPFFERDDTDVHVEIPISISRPSWETKFLYPR